MFEAFHIFDEVDNKCKKFNDYNPVLDDNIIKRNDAILEYLKGTENKPIDIFSTPSIAKKVNDINYKGYMNVNLKKFRYESSRFTYAIRDS